MKFVHALRFAKKHAKADNARKFAQHMVPHVVRPAQIIWNQAIGAIFLLMGLYFLSYAATHTNNLAAVIGGLFMGILMTFFGIGSFLRARRLARLSRL